MRQSRKAFTLVELIMTIVASAVLMFAAGAMLMNSSHFFQQTYNSVNKKINVDARALTSAFTYVGRKSNRLNYTVYNVKNDIFTEAKLKTGETVVKGQAVEFRFWSEKVYQMSDMDSLLEVDNTGTDYALFYLDGDELKVDYGKIINGVGGVSGGVRNTGTSVTHVLAENVDLKANTDIFSHTVTGGAGDGCVSLDITLTDDDDVSVEIKTATFLRACWPR